MLNKVSKLLFRNKAGQGLPKKTSGKLPSHPQPLTETVEQAFERMEELRMDNMLRTLDAHLARPRT